jgi:Fe-S-cluster containining protein
MTGINIMPVEELNITDYLDDTLNSKMFKLIKSRLIDWFDYFDRNTPSEPLNIEDLVNFGKQYALDKQKCPFLFNSECLIYKARPMVCRTHIVANNPDACKIDPLRDPSTDAHNIKYTKREELENLDKKQMPRLLPYALTDYFKIKRSSKAIIQIKSYPGYALPKFNS